MRTHHLTGLLLLLAALTCVDAAAQTTHPLGEQDPAAAGFNVGGNLQNSRGWRFQVNAPNVVVSELGCSTPASGVATHTLTLWDVATQAILAQVNSNPAAGAGWQWVPITPVALTQGAQYIVSVYTPNIGQNTYYHRSFTPPSSWLPTGTIQYLDMRYNNNVGPSVYPTSTLSNYQYGVADIGYTTGTVFVRTVATAPAYVTPGQAGIPLSVTVENVGGSDINSASVTPHFADSGAVNRDTDYTVTPSGANPTVITAGTTATFDFTVDVGPAPTMDTITIDAEMSGIDAGSGNPVSDLDADTTDAWTVVPCYPFAELRVRTVDTAPTEVLQGATGIPLTVTVENTGSSLADSVVLALSFMGSVDRTAEYTVTPGGANPSSIAGGVTETFDFTIDVSPAATLEAITIDARVDANDPGCGTSLQDLDADTPDGWTVRDCIPAGGGPRVPLAAAVPTLVLPAAGGNSRMTIAHHPGFDQYYGFQGGSPSMTYEVFDGAGNPLFNCGCVGIDGRSVYYNPNTGNLENASYNARGGGGAYGLFALGLDASGFYTGTNTLELASVPGLASSQSCPAYDPGADLLYSRSGGGTVSVASRATGALQGTITLNLAAAGNPSLANYSIGYTGYAGVELVVASNSTDAAVVFDIAGNYVGSVPLGFNVNTSYSGNFANGQFWVFDSNGNVWRGFDIFTPGCAQGADLLVRAVDTAPVSVQQGQTGINVTVTVENTGTADADSVVPTLTFTGSADRTGEYVVTPGGANPTTIAAGATEIFSFTVDVDPWATAEAITIDAQVTGRDRNCCIVLQDLDADTTDSWTVQACPNPADLRVRTVSAPPMWVEPAQVGIPVSVTVENIGVGGADSVTVSLTFTGSADRTSEYTVTPSGANPTTIGAGATETFDFTVDVSPGATLEGITIDAQVTANDTNCSRMLGDMDADTPDAWTVVPCAGFADLRVRTVDTAPVLVEPNMAGIALTVTVENIGPGPADSAAVSLTFTGTADRTAEYVVTPSGANPTTIAGLTTETFDFTIDVTAAPTFEAITIDAQVSASDTNCGGAIQDPGADTTDAWTVVPCVSYAELHVRVVDTAPALVLPGTVGIPLTVTVENVGPGLADAVAVSLTFMGSVDRTGEYTVTPGGANPASIASGVTETFDFTIDVSPAATLEAITIDAQVNASQPGCGGNPVQDLAADTPDGWTVVDCIPQGAGGPRVPLAAAVPTLVLPAAGGNSRMTIAHHPGFDQYYGFQGGNPSMTYEVFDGAGNPVFNCGCVGIDGRSVYYNPNTGNLENASYNARGGGGAYGLFALGLDASGFYTGTNTLELASVPGLASSQTCPAYDPGADLLYSRSGSGTVSVASRATGALQGTITLNLAAAGNPSLANYSIGYTGYAGVELVVASNSTDAAVVFDIAGNYVGSVPLGFNVNTSYSGNFANGQFWVFDSNGNVWRGFDIFTPGCAPQSNLRVRSVITAPVQVAPGTVGINVDVVVENTGTADVDSAVVSLTFTGSADRTAEYTVTPSPTNPDTIVAGTTETFQFSVDVGAGATQEIITVDAGVSGRDLWCCSTVQSSGADMPDLWEVTDCLPQAAGGPVVPAPVATPVLLLPAAGGNPRGGVAYHPGFARYYAFEAGNASGVYEVFDAAGSPLYQCTCVSVDGRGMYYNPSTGDLECVSTNAVAGAGPADGLIALGLDASGFYTGAITQIFTPVPGLASAQTCPAFDPGSGVLYSRSGSGTVNVVDRANGALLGTISLDLVSAGSPVVAAESIGYTGVAGHELVVASNSTDAALLFDLAGTFTGSVPLGFDVNTTSSGNFANGLFWVFDDAGDLWRGFDLFETDCVSTPDLRVLVVDTPPAMVLAGQTGIPLSVTVQNAGTAAADNVVVSLTFTGSADRTGEYTVTPAGANPTTIAAGATETYQFTIDVQNGATQESIVIDAQVTGRDTFCCDPVQDLGADVTDSWDVAGCNPTVCGDCDMNGDVTITDTLLCLQIDAGLMPEPPPVTAQYDNCNVTGTAFPDPGSSIGVMDGLAIALYVVGRDTLTCCGSSLQDFGDEVLIIATPGSGQEDAAVAAWNLRGVVPVIMEPSPVNLTYPTGDDLRAQFFCIWMGPEHFQIAHVANPDMMAMMGPGGQIDQFVDAGGIFVTHAAHNQNPGDVTGVAGAVWSNYTGSGALDNAITINDADHEFIDGTPYGGLILTNADFQNWSWSTHGHIDPPPGFVDSGGVNLGTNPTAGVYNAVITSPANGGAAAYLEFCHGAGYCFVNMSTLDWDTGSGNRGTPAFNGSQDVCQQYVDYILFIRPGFSN